MNSFSPYYETMILKMYDVPVVKWITHIPDTLLTALNFHPWSIAENIPIIVPSAKLLHTLGGRHLLNRFIVNDVASVEYGVINLFLYSNRRFITPEAKHLQSRLSEDLFIGDGIYGIRDIKQTSFNVETVHPAQRKASRFSDQADLSLPAEYDEFLSKYPEGSILVAFGTSSVPSEETTKVLIQAAEQMPQYGFIYSLKEGCSPQRLVKDANLPNIFLKSFVPQKQILSDARVLAFVSHGGANSVLESLYYGKVLLGSPIESDQAGVCYRVEKMGAGISLQTNPSLDKVLSSFKMVLD